MFNEARMGKAINIGSAVSLVEEITSSVMRNPGALIGLARLKTKDDYTYIIAPPTRGRWGRVTNKDV
jgi:hypothetical protein